MRSLIYSRVSQDRAQGRSVDEQERESRRLCADNDWEVVEAITDSVGASRHSKGTRSGWSQITRLLEAGEVDVLVTWEASRAQRDLAAYSELRDLCVRTGTLWSYSGRTHDLSKSDDRFRTGIDALIAEREADEIAERVQRAMRSNAAQGRPHGRRLFGYQRTYDPTTGALTGQIPDEHEAAIVRRIFDEHLAGSGISLIARGLVADGETTGTGAKWTGPQVHRVLTNPAYIARRVHRGEVIGDATWPPLIDVDSFERVDARLSRWGMRGQRQHPAHRLLSGVTRCGVCGGPMWVGHDRTKRKVYQCRPGAHVARDERALDGYVSELIVGRLEQSETVDLLAAEPTPEMDDTRRHISELRDRLDDAVAQFTAGKLTGGTLAGIESQLLAEIRDAEARLRRTIMPLSFDVPSVDIADWWEKLERPKRRELVGALISAVVVHPTVRGQRTFDPSRVDVQWRV